MISLTCGGGNKSTDDVMITVGVCLVQPLRSHAGRMSWLDAENVWHICAADIDSVTDRRLFTR